LIQSVKFALLTVRRDAIFQGIGGQGIATGTVLEDCTTKRRGRAIVRFQTHASLTQPTPIRGRRIASDGLSKSLLGGRELPTIQGFAPSCVPLVSVARLSETERAKQTGSKQQYGEYSNSHRLDYR